LNGLALCAGIGGLDLGISIAVPEYRTVCYVEREAFAAAALVAQMQNGALAEAPIWDDLLTFDGRRWRGVTDIITAGIPCQPYSCAGKLRGHADERALWPEFIRIVDECQPALVFLENVAAFAWYFEPAGERLCELGYRLAAGIFSAAEVGAPHQRERFFMLAYRKKLGRERSRSGKPLENDASRNIMEGTAARPAKRALALGDADSAGFSRWQQSESEMCNQWLPWPPSPTDRARWWQTSRQLWPALTVREEAIESALCGVADGPPARVDRLRACGNGVVPLQAAYAFTLLARKLDLDGF
jgi:DNA (cytosine-5)-methyltransferase 1